MGTGFECEIVEEQEGIIPRAVRHLFASINDLKDNPFDENGVSIDTLQFSVGAQFMELYNEEIIDLLDPYNKVCIQFTVSFDYCCRLLRLCFSVLFGFVHCTVKFKRAVTFSHWILPNVKCSCCALYICMCNICIRRMCNIIEHENNIFCFKCA